MNGAIAPDGNGRWIEYAGGYSDMLTQRGADLQRASIKQSASAPQTAVPKEAKAAPQAKRRLSFNEKHALETLPKTIETLQAEITKQQKLLDDPELYSKDRKRFDQASQAIATAHDKLSEAETKWLELEMLREEIEQS